MKLILFATLLLTPAASLQDSVDLDTVVEQAVEYVAQYEAELGDLIGAEEYVQNAAWRDARYGQITERRRRRTSSDFLIIQVG